MQSSIRILALIIGLLVLPFTALPAHAQESADEPTADELASADEGSVEDEEAETAEEEEREAWAGIEEITVTANKREQAMQDVPISMSALQSGFIEDAGITEFGQLQQFVPNLKINPTTDTRSTVIRIRGIGSVGNNAGIDPSVGVFIDGVYQGRAGMSVGDLLDIERIEVLRGPQGTLYGKNTAAGTINIHTMKPVYDFESTAEVVVGDYDTMEFRGSVNVPLWGDRIAARLAAYRVLRDGFDTNSVTGKDVNDGDKWGLRGRFLFDASPNLEILVSGDYSYEDTECCAPDILSYEGGSPMGLNRPGFPEGGYNLCQLTWYSENPGATTGPSTEYCENLDEHLGADGYDQVVEANVDPTNEITVGGASINAELALGDFTLSSLTAWRTYGSYSAFDGDFTRYDAVGAFTDVDLNQLSQEFQVVSPSGEIYEYQGGLYFYFQDMDTMNRLGIRDEYNFLTGAYNDTSSLNRTYSLAAYGQGTYNLNDQWSFTGGIRLSWEKKTRVGSQISQNCEIVPSTGEPIDVPPICGPSQFVDNDKDWINLSGMATLRYFPVEGVMLYGSYSRGFKSGGFNQLRTLTETLEDNNTQFEPEYSTNLEAGAKTTWFDRMLTLNGTFFYTWYSDFQAQTFDGADIRVVNAGSMRSYGVEADLVLAPLPDLIIGTSLGFNIAKYKFYPDAENTVPSMVEASENSALLCNVFPDCSNKQNLSGERLDNAPHWTVSSYAQYEIPVPVPGLSFLWRIQAEYAYTSWLYLAADLDPNLKQDSTHLLNLRTGVRAEDELWSVMFWVKNVTDEDWNMVGFDAPIVGGYAGVNGPPRQYGATFRVKF